MTERMSGFERGHRRKGEEEQRPNLSKFVMSTQILSSREREHLLRFMKMKQKEQHRKAKLTEKNKEELKKLRKRGRKLYKIL